MLLLVDGPTQDQPYQERNVPSLSWERFDATSSLRFYQSVRNCCSSSKFQAPSANQARYSPTRKPSSLQAHESPLESSERASSLERNAQARSLEFTARPSSLQAPQASCSRSASQVPCAHATEDGSSPRRRPSSVRSSSRSGASKFTRASFSLQGAIAGPSLQASRALAFALRAHVSILKQARSSLSSAQVAVKFAQVQASALGAARSSCTKLPQVAGAVLWPTRTAPRAQKAGARARWPRRAFYGRIQGARELPTCQGLALVVQFESIDAYNLSARPS